VLLCPKSLHNHPLIHTIPSLLVGGWVDGGMVVRVWREGGEFLIGGETGFEGMVRLLGVRRRRERSSHVCSTLLSGVSYLDCFCSGYAVVVCQYTLYTLSIILVPGGRRRSVVVATCWCPVLCVEVLSNPFIFLV
jgi:hypothetical protein